MSAFRKTGIALASLAAASFALTACGGGVDRAQLKDDLISRLQSESGLTQEQATCVAEGIDGFSDTELEQLNTENPPQELQEKTVDVILGCVGE
jgi:hypothetical protein